MKSSTKKRIKMVSFAILLVLLTMTIYCGKVEAADSLNCYVAKKYTGGDLEVGKTYYVVESNIDSEVYITDSIVAAAVEAIEPTTENYWGRYEFDYRYMLADGSMFLKNVKTIENRGHFDGCPYGTIISKNDKNLVDKNTNENLSGSVNEYLYWCDGGGVENLTIFLFTSLEQATITADNITIEQISDFEEGDTPTEDDFKVIVKVNDTEYVLNSASNTDNPYYVIKDPKEIEEGENTVKILVYNTFEMEITVKPKEEIEEQVPEVKEEIKEEIKEVVKEEKDETPKTGSKRDSILFLTTMATISIAGSYIINYKNRKNI